MANLTILAHNYYLALAYGLFLILIIPTVFYQPQWRFIGLSESVDTLRHEEVSTVISFVNSINLALAIPTNDKEANLITVVDSNFPNINKISVHMKGSITGGSNAGVRVIFIGK